MEPFDVALVACDVPAAIRDDIPLSLSERLPEDGATWLSEGFARAGGKDDQQRRKSFALQGKVLSKPTHVNQFQLTNEHAPQQGDAWKGVSGSPVIIGQHIVGVIVSYAGQQDVNTLEATPVAKFIGHPEFQDKLGYAAKKTRQQAFEQLMIALLQADTPATAELEKQFDVGHHQLCDALMQTDIASVLEKCSKAYQQLKRKADQPGCTTIAELLNHVLPALYDHGIVEHIRQRKMDIHTAIFHLPVGISTLAGVIMAGVDRQPFQPRLRTNAVNFPDSINAIPHAPEMGFDATGDDLVAAWKSHIEGKFAGDTLRHMQLHFHRYITRHFSEPSDATKDVRTIAADELAYLAEEEQQTYYFVIDAQTETEHAERHLEQLIREFKQTYPAIVFVQLDPNMTSSDKGAYRKYRSMLPCST